jgi:dCMP deaminase
MPNSPTDLPKVVNVYIDGYNFYYSISNRIEPELLQLGWCNFGILADRLVKKAWPAARVGAVKYYTALVPRHLEIRSKEVERQTHWLEALKFGTKGRVKIIEGYYTRHNDKPRTEKQSDVSLAISMVRDALMSPTDDRHDQLSGEDEFASCEGVIGISADKDFLPAAKMVGSYGKKVAIFRPLGHALDGRPKYQNVEYFDITEEDLRRSRLPDRIEQDKGKAITWTRYCELKADSMRASRKIAPPDPEFDCNCQHECRLEAEKSIDTDTQVGCVVVDLERKIQVRGHNTLPRGIAAEPPERLGRPDKYTWVEHAERNAIYSAARSGIELAGCTMYVDLTPCVDCARGIIQAGLWEVVVSKERMRSYSSPTYREQQMIAASLLKEAGVVLRMA